jgi:DNA-binding CsgD family transcriptional regulator
MSPDEFINACHSLFPATRAGKNAAESGISGFARRVGLKPDTVHEELRRRRRAGTDMPQHYLMFIKLLEEINWYKSKTKYSYEKMIEKRHKPPKKPTKTATKYEKKRADRIQQILEMTSRGMRFGEIAVKLGMTRAGLHRFRKLYMPETLFKQKSNRKTFDIPDPARLAQIAERIATINEALERNLNWIDIASKLGMSREGLYAFRVEHMPDTISKYKKYTDDVLKQIEQMAASGKSMPDIAKTLGLSGPRIFALRKSGALSFVLTNGREKRAERTP